MFKRTSLLAIFSAALFSLALASAASAQAPWWGQHDDDDDHYGRDRRDRRRDGDYRNRGYDTRELRDVAERIKDGSKNLERDVDRFLDNSRHDNTDREDHVNSDVREFRRAAERFRSRVGSGRDINRGAGEARELLSAGEHAGRMLSRLRVDSRTYSTWSRINRDLRTVADIYRISYRGGDDGYYRRGGYDPRYPNDRDNRNRGRTDGWWRRIPQVIGRP